MQNEEARIHFWEPDSVCKGDLVWVYEGNSLVGPMIVTEEKTIGYGSNKKLIYRLIDASTGWWHQSQKKWLRVPMEIT